jgi:hypothetical protein
MVFGISHDWAAETPEAKARWFQSLSLEERMEIFCEITELALASNPELAEKGVPSNAHQAERGVLILRIP